MAGDGFPSWLGEAFGAIPGVVALIGASVGYGRLQTRVSAVEHALDGEGGVKAKIDSLDQRLGAVSGTMQRLDERTAFTQATVSKMDGKMDTILSSVVNALSHLTRSH